MPDDPRGRDLNRYMNEDPGGPVVMLNLLKYRPEDERSYRAYAAALKDYLRAGQRSVLNQLRSCFHARCRAFATRDSGRLRRLL